MAGLVPIEQLDVDRGGVERVRAQALANWLPPEQWSPETRAAVEEMLVAAPERIERVVGLNGW